MALTLNACNLPASTVYQESSGFLSAVLVSAVKEVPNYESFSSQLLVKLGNAGRALMGEVSPLLCVDLGSSEVQYHQLTIN
ncbi:hypothetical protein Bpfe_011381 [Biomphalaria pfeifferi]|uniref:Uncharacterized protein n=1 Tax=Biomphalaria pfeifferi TaxID=112525 RepID=A0AAD8BRE2_BIOPF|nr:hypothetical protein Bpfe_011381 [Biomphalaria pfeifferi]